MFCPFVYKWFQLFHYLVFVFFLITLSNILISCSKIEIVVASISFLLYTHFFPILLARKLLKKLFGVVKNECLFDRNYYKKLAWFIWFSAQLGLCLRAVYSHYKSYSFCINSINLVAWLCKSISFNICTAPKCL